MYEKIKDFTDALKASLQDAIDEELEKVVPRDDPKFMEMRKMNIPVIVHGNKQYGKLGMVAALCPPKWVRKSPESKK